MLCRVRELDGGGYKVTASSTEGVADERETSSLQEAFDWQAHYSKFGEFPPDPILIAEVPPPAPAHEPEVKARKTKGGKK